MGIWGSTPEWREGPKWNEKENMMETLRAMRPNHPDVDQIRILLHGPVGAGKSSFINTVKSVFAGRMSRSVVAEDNSACRSTTTYKTHFIQDGASSLPFVFNDIMGMENGETGIRINDIINALKGHVKEDYEFDHEGLTMQDTWYNGNPRLNDKVHCLVSVVSAESISLMVGEDRSSKVIRDMRAIRKEATKLGLPQFLIMTMPDRACPDVAKNLKTKIYRSKIIEKKMEMCSNELGAPMNCIFPVKNYSSETTVDAPIEVLALDAVTQIVQAANDYLWSLQPSPEWSEAPDWNGKEKMMETLRAMRPDHPDVDQIRIMLHGPVGAGKSSFINTVKSVFAGHMVRSVVAEANTATSCTRKYKKHLTQDGESSLSFVFNDVMGMENGETGIRTDDIINALKGHVRDDYEFVPERCLGRQDEWYNGNPRLSDKIHCLVSVVSADNISRTPEVITNMRAIRKEANRLEIPQLLIMTMPDKACPDVAKDLKTNIYRSKIIETKMEVCCNELGAPMNCIFPVKNYSSEKKMDATVDVLALDAVTQIVQAANDHLWSLQQ